jgi:hypothetical protein
MARGKDKNKKDDDEPTVPRSRRQRRGDPLPPVAPRGMVYCHGCEQNLVFGPNGPIHVKNHGIPDD